MIKTFDGAIQSLREVQDNLPKTSPDRAKLEAVIVYIDGEVRDTVSEAVKLMVEMLVIGLVMERTHHVA